MSRRLAADEGAGLRDIFAARRGRLLTALLLAELGGAVQSTAYATVLPVTSNELSGGELYGATLLAGGFATILVLALGPGPFARFGPGAALAVATGLYLVGVGLTVAAPAMVFVLAGTVVRGVAGGLLAGMGLTAVGALYEDRLRPRVVGLYAMVWLLPSLVGPIVNAAITVAFGWRVAMAWPAVLVVLGRVLVGRDASLIPWGRTKPQRAGLPDAAVLLGGLVLAALAPAFRGPLGIVVLVAGAVIAAAFSVRILRARLRERPRVMTGVVMLLLCLAFFGGSAVISLAVVNTLGAGVVAGSLAVTAGLLGWSVTGLRPAWIDDRAGDPQLVGLAGVALGLAGVAVSILVPLGPAALGLLIVSWLFAGVGMGLAYNRVAAESLEALAPKRMAAAATMTEFAEATGTALGALVSGGAYSVAVSMHADPGAALGLAFTALAAIALTGFALRLRRRATAARE